MGWGLGTGRRGAAILNEGNVSALTFTAGEMQHSARLGREVPLFVEGEA